MLRRTLLDLLEEPPGTLHTIDVAEEPLERECARYEEVVATGGLDLTLLGLGRNGHIGLNEPGTDAASLTRPVRLEQSTVANAARYGSQRLPTRGVTLGLRPLLASREIWLLVTGTSKAAVLAAAVTGPVGPHLPASYLQQHDNCRVLADASAADLLSAP
jgi:glucosamine-6-phosphate deaminase